MCVCGCVRILYVDIIVLCASMCGRVDVWMCVDIFVCRMCVPDVCAGCVYRMCVPDVRVCGDVCVHVCV